MNATLSICSLLLIAGLLAGCAMMMAGMTGKLPPNAYGPSGKRGGYSQTQIAEDRFLVYFKGTWSEEERVTDLAMLRAAQLTIEQGASHFVILSQAVYKEGVDRGQGAAIPIGPVSIGGSSQSDRLTTRLMIQVLTEPQEDAEAVHDAKTIRDDIATKHKIDRKHVLPSK